MKEKIKEIWDKHKTKIIIGSVVVGGVATCIVVRQYSFKKLSKKTSEWAQYVIDKNIVGAVTVSLNVSKLATDVDGKMLIPNDFWDKLIEWYPEHIDILKRRNINHPEYKFISEVLDII